MIRLSDALRLGAWLHSVMAQVKRTRNVTLDTLSLALALCMVVTLQLPTAALTAVEPHFSHAVLGHSLTSSIEDTVGDSFSYSSQESAEASFQASSQFTVDASVEASTALTTASTVASSSKDRNDSPAAQSSSPPPTYLQRWEQQFIADNFDAILRECAAGEGEYLHALAQRLKLDEYNAKNG